MNKKYLAFLLITILVISTITIIIFITKPSMVIIKSESHYSNYEIIGNNVYINCVITIKNTGSEEKTVKLIALFHDDVDALLQNEKLYAVNKDDNSEIFIVPPKSQKTIEVYFIGDFAGKDIKNNRLLPDIIIENVD